MTFGMTLYYLQLAGVAVSACSGALSAGRRSLDLIGVSVIATVTALGGGTLRDLLLDRHPVFWIRDPTYLALSLTAGFLTLAYTRFSPPPWKALLVADAFGLAFFTISGAQVSEQMGQEPIVSLVMGVMTGVAGGVLRDLLCAQVPMILRRGHLYASAALIGAATYLLLRNAVESHLVCSLSGMVTILAFRLAAIIWDLRVPVFHVPGGDEP